MTDYDLSNDITDDLIKAIMTTMNTNRKKYVEGREDLPPSIVFGALVSAIANIINNQRVDTLNDENLALGMERSLANVALEALRQRRELEIFNLIPKEKRYDS